MLIANIAIDMVLGNHVIYICFNLLPFAVMELNLFHYTFTGDVENDEKVIGGGRV